MPLKRMPQRRADPLAEELKRRLAEEWASPKDSGQPIILIQPADAGGGTRVYVVWDDWGGLSQQVRSETIMDVFEQIHTEEESLKVTVAMGLTVQEADRMNIPYE